MARHKVLIIAEQANPEWVSSPLVAWSHYQALSRLVDAHLVVQVRNREAILRAGVSPDAVTAIDSEQLAAPLWRLGSLLRGGAGRGWSSLKATGAFAYYYFEHLLWKRFEGRLRAGEFDLVHRLAPISPTWPSILAGRCARIGVPFVVGPINGGLPWPPGFGASRRREVEWLSYLRGLHKLLPGYKATRRDASALVIGSRATLDDTAERWRSRCVYIPENGIDPGRFPQTKPERRPGKPLRACFVGRLVPYKGADMLLEAAAPLIRSGKLTLDIMGDGPERESLARFVEREGLLEGVKLDGWVEQAALPGRLVQSDLFVFPSVREFGGGVVLEAMAAGVVPVVVDYGGPAELVTDETGFRIPLGSRHEIVSRLRALLEKLVARPEGIHEMGGRARDRVLDLFSWDAKARQMLEIYAWALGERPERPDFGMPLSRRGGEREAA